MKKITLTRCGRGRLKYWDIRVDGRIVDTRLTRERGRIVLKRLKGEADDNCRSGNEVLR